MNEDDAWRGEMHPEVGDDAFTPVTSEDVFGWPIDDAGPEFWMFWFDAQQEEENDG